MQQHHRQIRFTFLEGQRHRKIGHLGSSNFPMTGWGFKLHFIQVAEISSFCVKHPTKT